jgi:hypothetical protein
METFIVTIKDKKKTAFAEELLRSFDFLDVKKQKSSTSKKSNALTKREKQLSAAFKEINGSLKGKKHLKTLDEALHEL